MSASSTDNIGTASGVAWSESPQSTAENLEIGGNKANVQFNATTIELRAIQASNSEQDNANNENEKKELVLASNLSGEVAFPTTNGELNEEQLEDLTSNILKLNLHTTPSASSISSQIPERLFHGPDIKRRNSAEHDLHGYCAGQFDESIPSRNRAGSIQNYNPSVATPVDHLAREIDSEINHLARWVHQLRSMQLQDGFGFDAGIARLNEQMGVDPSGKWAAQLHFTLGIVRDMKADAGKEPLSEIIEKSIEM